MPLDITAGLPAPGCHHSLPATPETCVWGVIDRDLPPVIEVGPGDVLTVETVTHHAGDAPDLMMDDGIRELWAGIPESERGPGVHLITGPIAVRGARPGDTLVVRILEVEPRLGFGSNCAAHWGLLYDAFRKERITIYGLDETVAGHTGFGATASPMFAYDFTTRPLYDLPGVVTPKDPRTREPFTQAVRIPVRPHLGVMGVAPKEPGRRSSIPPGCFGGNVDNWRIGAGATVCYPVSVDGANLFLGDPHYAQGDGEICGTAIEASMNVTIQVDVRRDLGVTSPLLETSSQWFTHGFGAELNGAMRMAAEQMLWFLQDHLGLTRDDAYSLASVAVDLGITQVVDGTLGCHAGVDRRVFG